MTELEWILYFKDEGYSAASVLGSGMDGTVYLLIPGELVAKCWHLRKSTHLEKLKLFYESLQKFSRTIETPSIHEIHEVLGQTVTLEKLIPGAPLDSYLGKRHNLDDSAIKTMLTSLRFLDSVSTEVEAGQLPLLGDHSMNYITRQYWSERICGLISRRLEISRPRLNAVIPELDAYVEAVGDFLMTRDSAAMRLVRGDLFGGNVVVNEDLNPVGILDFGHLTTIGDPAFDAGITSGIFNMYGPNAEKTSGQLLDSFETHLGHTRNTMLAYRAVYALLTSNVYSSKGLDGHFNWSVSQLNNKLVRDALNIR